MNNKSFDEKRIATGYAKDRPFLHKLVIERLKKDCSINTLFQNGLDVGCGAGLSTKALRLLSDKVTGTDISPEMIKLCKQLYPDSGFTFYTAKAEETRIPDTPYDIVTAAGVVNWVDKDAFLQNMIQVTSDNALLVIYDFWISDKMIGSETYTQWYNEQYLPLFPKPPRQENIWTAQDLPTGLQMKGQVSYQLQYPFEKESFIRFMMIQSNVNAQITAGHKSEAEIYAWMDKTLTPIFHSQTKQLIFDGYSWYLQKTALK
ncbi:MAG: class I SAM-dependent methyltransferase [Muribaculaceae bacterium]|nr:class I SAM-dependent methyltransferase [Muribaculaceae bacterium]